jgi:hypothetical protein
VIGRRLALAAGPVRAGGRGAGGRVPGRAPGRRRDRSATAGRAELDVAVVLDLLDAACLAGCSVPGALAAVGEVAGGRRGRDLARAARRLHDGAPWPEAWAGADPRLAPVADAVRPSWEDGVAPAGALRAAAATLRRERQAAATAAAGRLGVRLVLPLAVCHLPAFVLVGLVPVLVSVAGATVG